MNRQNDLSLLGDLLVYRRIPPTADRVRWNADGTPEPTSQNFRDPRTDELSVHLATETTPETTLADLAGFGLVQLTLQVFRSVFQAFGKTLVICRDDLDPANGHVLICGDITNGMAKKIRNAACWVEGRWPVRIDPE